MHAFVAPPGLARDVYNAPPKTEKKERGEVIPSNFQNVVTSMHCASGINRFVANYYKPTGARNTEKIRYLQSNCPYAQANSTS